ncbi:MAG: proton-conducting transporter membrane subunit, partial [Anaerolineales bacterium]
TGWVYIIGAIALAGIPPFAGFFSKDEILAEATTLNSLAYILLTIAAFFTAFYMGRQIWMVFFGKARHAASEQAEESPLIITGPLMVLALLSVLGGALNLPGLHTFTDWLEHTYEYFHVHLHTGEFNLGVALTSTLLALTAILFAWLLYGRRSLTKDQEDPLRRILGPVFVAMENKWWVDELYWAVILNPYIALARILAETVDWRFWHDWFHDVVIVNTFTGVTRFLSVPFDLGIIDGFANGLADATKALAGVLRRIQTGFVRNYALSVFIGVVIIIGYLILS